MEPWYKIATPRSEVREGRSFNPDEFAIALEQVVAGTAPLDYRDAEKFFSRTYFTRALKEHAGMVLRRLSGKTENTAPVLTLVTQFGGGKTHTLTALYHIAKNGSAASRNKDVMDLISGAGLSTPPQAKVAVFVGNAWDPKDDKETPWIDVAHQLAGAKGVAALGKKALSTPPGTESLSELFTLAGGSVLILFDEVLNFINRHRDMSDSFHAFLQNLTVAMTGTQNCAAVISLPRSLVEMTPRDLEWQEKITKVVRRVAKDLIANDEAEISEVVRRRLFEDLGKDSVRKSVSKSYADWCFERRAQLPPEWTAVDSAATESKAREYLRSRFEACYPFHPATLSVFQRKWQGLPQYQQTRGTLAMLAQWISWVYRDNFTHARKEALITLGSAPLGIPEFQATIIGQLGEGKLISAIDTDIAGQLSHARALDVDTKGPLKDIHRRAGAAIFFESTGLMKERIAHLPELRFALGEPEIDTTSIDNAATALESKAFFLRRSGSDGFQFGYKPTLKKVVNDRRASLDDEEVKKETKALVKREFEKGAAVPIQLSPEDSAAIPDSPRLVLIVMDPEVEWNDKDGIKTQLTQWCRERGNSPRTYPGSLVFCLRKPGRALREKMELWLAWKRVADDIAMGVIGGDFEQDERRKVAATLKDAEDEARDEVWASYRFAYLLDSQSESGMKIIDLGAGHASNAEPLAGRVITALKSAGLLNESVGAGYIERNWPQALKESGAWSLLGLRQSFLNGSLTRLIDPDKVLKIKIPDFVRRGEFGLASGPVASGGYEKVWYNEAISPDEVLFDAQVFLLTRSVASSLKKGKPIDTEETPAQPSAPALVLTGGEEQPHEQVQAGTSRLRISGEIPPEVWNRFGSRILPKLRSSQSLKLGVALSCEGSEGEINRLRSELRQALSDLGLSGSVVVE